MAAINAMCYRALMCLNNKDKEVDRIKNVVNNIIYEPKIVDKITQRINKATDEENRYKDVDKETYLGAISYVNWKTEKNIY